MAPPTTDGGIRRDGEKSSESRRARNSAKVHNLALRMESGEGKRPCLLGGVSYTRYASRDKETYAREKAEPIRGSRKRKLQRLPSKISISDQSLKSDGEYYIVTKRNK